MKRNLDDQGDIQGITNETGTVTDHLTEETGEGYRRGAQGSVATIRAMYIWISRNHTNESLENKWAETYTNWNGRRGILSGRHGILRAKPRSGYLSSGGSIP